MKSKDGVSRVETVLRDNGALGYLKSLVDAGCSRDELISYMDLAFFADDSWETLVDMNLRGFKEVIKKIRACAGIVDRLNHTDLIHSLSLETHDPRFAGLYKSPTLPEQLREYASKLDSLRAIFGPRRSVRLHAWKSLFVANVTEDTKKPHDLEVSALIAAILGFPKYSQDAHKTWRLKNRSLIENMRKTARDRRLKKTFMASVSQ